MEHRGLSPAAPALEGLSPDTEFIVGVSGGVDSAVALSLIQNAGYPVRALFMKNWEEDDRDSFCAAAADLEHAERVCKQLGVELKTVNLATEYWDKVFVEFLRSYRDGQTPNPDVLCNREIKFRVFLDFATSLGADVIATGHYVQKRIRDGRFRLLKGADPEKDQSYFLCLLDQKQLARSVFPVGASSKRTVRQIAKRLRLPNHARKDSTGICFIGERPFRQFLSRYLPPEPGPILSEDGRVIGKHDGLMYYTIGQRQGLGIGGDACGTGDPWYVAGKQYQRNALLVVQGRRNPKLYTNELEAANPHWIAGEPPALPIRCRAKIRYRQPDQNCAVEPCVNGNLRVRFERPQWGVASGQTVVFYEGDECLGGATIDSAAQ